MGARKTSGALLLTGLLVLGCSECRRDGDHAEEGETRDDALLGVWRLVSLTSGGHPVHTGETHLVVREDELWEVWPSSTYYEDEPDREREYQLTWNGSDGRLEVVRSGAPNECSILRIEGNVLRLRRGSIAGRFPRSFRDEDGTLATYERVTDEADIAALLRPQPRVTRPTRDHHALGRLRYDDDLEWWVAEVRFCGRADVPFHVGGSPTMDDERLDDAAQLLQAIDCGALKRYASHRLLTLKNGNWLGDDEDPLTAPEFEARLSPESLGVHADGRVSVYFDDGNLFFGHVIIVELDKALQPVDAEIAG